ncbi:MAG TPA: YkgJ family cysteine cluster protein [Bacteroidia bacterium]|nr:YkgJ family cysteine cluster protein [Bacteroidia bacterium]
MPFPEISPIFLPMSVHDMEEGMRYVCQRCGNCCRWPGEVPVSDAEIGRIADHLGLPESEFIERYTEVNVQRTSLTLISRPNHECIFLDGIDCRIQAVKPDQCAGFPNQWNFPGWRQSCEAIPVPSATEEG